jgi:hypothetical protein
MLNMTVGSKESLAVIHFSAFIPCTHMLYSLLISWLSIWVGLKLPKTVISLRFWSLKIGGRTKNATKMIIEGRFCSVLKGQDQFRE